MPKIIDLSSETRSLISSLPSYVSVDFLVGRKAVVRGNEYTTNHYPLHDALKIGSLIKESHLLDNMQSAMQYVLSNEINKVLFDGTFTSNVNGDTDWHNEFNVKREIVKYKKVDEYFKSLGYQDIHYVNFCGHELAFPANLDVIRVAFSPANRFNTINTLAKPSYVFKYENEETNAEYNEYIFESNFIVILDKPELIVEVI